tara:strand:- start:1956 stop:3440 length:1485 start_codon:yes stop_codon:yes gene_type:complete
MKINNDYNYEIDLKQIFELFIRNKRSLFIFTLISTIISFSYTLSLKPLWSGNFNILINNQNKYGNASSASLLNNNSLFSQLKVNSDSETQRLILSSPFVLNSVYNSVLKYKEINSQKSNLSFKAWISSVEITFANGSNVLNITHTNTDKVLLLKTLELIAEKYKEYSKKEQIKNISKTKDYLETQTAIMSKKAYDSKKRLNKFSIENNLGSLDGLISFQGNKNDLNINSKERATNPGLRFESQFKLLQTKEANYNNLSQFLKPSSKTLKNLRKEIDFLKTTLKRPTEILIRYEELAEESLRNSTLLFDLQKSLEVIKLEEIKTPDPWQLISEPLISKRPISASKKKKLYYSLLASFFLSSIFVFLKEKFSGLIYYKSNIDSKLNANYLETLDKNQLDLSLKIIKNSIKFHSEGLKDKFIGIVNYDSKAEIGLIQKSLGKNLNILFLDLNDKKIEECEKIFLIFEKGKLNFDDLSLINKYISIYKEKFVGWFFIC